MNRDDAQWLHQMLHQIAESTKQDPVALLADVLRESLSAADVTRLLQLMSTNPRKLATS